MQLLEENVKPFEFYDEAKKQFLEAKNPKWEKAVLDKFSWIKYIQSNSALDEELKPRDFALMSDEDAMEQKDFNAIKLNGDKLRQYLTKKTLGDFVTTVSKTTIVQDYPENFTWRDLFLKLCFE